MSSSEAQKSPVHQATEDSTSEPTNTGRVPGTPRRSDDRPDAATRPGGDAMERRSDPDNEADLQPPGALGGGPGAGDASSGGGAGGGIPGGGTDMRTDGAFAGGDVEQDRRKLFPEVENRRDDAEKIGPDKDESSYGGPLNLDDPEAV